MGGRGGERWSSKGPKATAYEVSLEKAEADVSYDSGKTTPERIAESVSKTGFKASAKRPATGEGGGSAAEESLVAAPEGAKCGASCQGDCCKARKHRAAAADEADTPGLVTLAKGFAPLASVFAEYLKTRDGSQPEWDIYLFFEPGTEWTTRAGTVALGEADRALRWREGWRTDLVMWRNDYASPPVEESLTEELRKLVPGTVARVVR